MIPYFTVSGTYYQVGKQIGKKFRELIVDYYGVDEDFKDVVFPFIQTKAGEKVYMDYLNNVETLYPQYVSEMQGLADGAGLTFKQVFTMHLSREIRIGVAVKQEWGCSDLFINYPKTGQVALGHNEDIDPMVKTRAYVVNVTIYDSEDTYEPRRVIEQFTAYTYPGHLPGSAFSFSAAGMVFNCNGLPPELICYDKIPRYILNRAMITAQSREEFEATLQCQGVGSGYGFSVNVVQMNKDESVLMWNYEIAPVRNSPSTLMHRISIGADGDTSTHRSGYYFHCNRYQHMTVPEIKPLTWSSKGRLTRFSELPAPKTIEDMMKVLEDETNEKYPIFRTPRPTDRNGTVAVAIYDFINKQLDIYEDKPSRCKPDLTLSLPDGKRI
ncbi:beta-alanyl-dopamine/carcinine hydrolase-like [Liolophura sinensis]|uniref:beta-alanyl-dopamine/carcinine hydrolase-like n=1 Tax=Liolophura sinensis TaxID=3198878 RepID=UPI003158A1F8